MGFKKKKPTGLSPDQQQIDLLFSLNGNNVKVVDKTWWTLFGLWLQTHSTCIPMVATNVN
jgi:hypothetical protein